MGNALSTLVDVYGMSDECGQEERHAVENEDQSLLEDEYMEESLTNFREEIRLLLTSCSNVHREFAKTSVYEELRCRVLQEATIGVTVIGNTGDGKTTAVKALAWELYRTRGFLPMEARSVQDIKELYESDKKLLFLVDDPFGAYRVYWDFVKDWVIRFSQLDKFISTGNVKIIITTRTQIWEECKFDFKQCQPFDNVVDMSSIRLTTQDRKAILRKWLLAKNIDISSWQWKWKIARIANIPSPFGFPLCCKLASEQDDLLRGIVSFFEQPLGFIRTELRRLTANRPQLYSALALLMLNDGFCSLRELDPLQPLSANLSIKSRDILQVCGLGTNNGLPSAAQVRHTLENLNGTFLQKTDDGFCFTHESLLFAVALELGQICPEVLLKHAHPQLLVQTIQTCRSLTRDSASMIEIKRDLYPQFAAVLTQELLRGHLDMTFSNQSWLEDEFYEIWERYVLSEANVDDFLFSTGRRWQRTILHCAARKGLLRMVKFLMTRLKADAVSLRDEDGVTVLHSAANGGQANIVDYLLKQGFDPNVQENAGWTPLYVSVLCGYTQIVRLLLLAGADPNISTIYGSTPMYAAALCEHWDLIPLLQSWGARSMDEYSSPGRPEFDLLSLLVEQDDSPVAALLRAARTGQLSQVVWLLDYAANVNDTNVCGWSSLYVSALCGRGDIASLLLHRGADPRLATFYGRTPSYVAKLCGHTDIAKMIDSFESGLVAV
ncbi:uncharacterized protein LOC135478470 [Liolophura sinensis]|uniref:uncharacterized protein LOC135478470 n=1 Tax=Liolophura sinensis TaxID=3198878 RepID=UPI0031583F8C